MKTIEDMKKEVDEKLSTEEGRQEFARELAGYCYEGLPKSDQLIYEEACTKFTPEECNGQVLPILVMGYLDYGVCTREAIIKDQSKLVEPFEVTEAMEWTITKLLENLPNTAVEC